MVLSRAARSENFYRLFPAASQIAIRRRFSPFSCKRPRELVCSKNTILHQMVDVLIVYHIGSQAGTYDAKV